MTNNVVKFPYSASRRVHSQKPRRSKNGTPEERAAKAAATQSPRASIVPLSVGGSSAAALCGKKSPRSRSLRRSSGRCAPPIFEGKIAFSTQQAGAKSCEQVRPPRGMSPMNSTKRGNAFSERLP